MMQSSLRRSLLTKSISISPNTGARRLFSGKEIKFGVEGRAAILKGVDLLADAVQVRLSLATFHIYVPSVMFSFSNIRNS